MGDKTCIKKENESVVENRRDFIMFLLRMINSGAKKIRNIETSIKTHLQEKAMIHCEIFCYFLRSELDYIFLFFC